MTNSHCVIVYGASGFLGSHVADAFTDAGYRVRIFDLKESPYLRNDQEMIIGDLRDTEAVCEAAAGCRYVLNFGAIADISSANENPPVTAGVNVFGTVNTLEAARQAGAERYLFASTVYVYARHGAMYKASKQAAECFIESYEEQYGLDYTILRYGTLYGRRANNRNRIHSFLRSAVEQGRIDYPGSAHAIREFIHVKDAARLTLEAIQPKYAKKHLILTGQEKYSVGQLLEMITELMPRKIEWSCAENEPPGHYMITPYSFQPRLGQKLVPSEYIDLGQGLVDCLSELFEQSEELPEEISGPTNGG